MFIKTARVFGPAEDLLTKTRCKRARMITQLLEHLASDPPIDRAYLSNESGSEPCPNFTYFPRHTTCEQVFCDSHRAGRSNRSRHCARREMEQRPGCAAAIFGTVRGGSTMRPPSSVYDLHPGLNRDSPKQSWINCSSSSYSRATARLGPRQAAPRYGSPLFPSLENAATAGSSESTKIQTGVLLCKRAAKAGNAQSYCIHIISLQVNIG
jgi:hypothetical protein